MKEYLEGGRKNSIIKVNNCVYRPAGEWSKDIHLFLKYLHSQGFLLVPYPYEIDQNGYERLSFVDGEIYHGGLPEKVKDDQTLISVAETLRKYHDYGEAYLKYLKGDEVWMLPARAPTQTMCHGDFAPYNIAISDNKVVGIIDFDTLHPGPRIWDISYALYRWIPLMDIRNPENFGSEEDKTRRIQIFMNSYGREYFQGEKVLEHVIERLDFLIYYMKQQAEMGNVTFIGHIKAGHLEGYIKDIEYIRHNSFGL